MQLLSERMGLKSDGKTEKGAVTLAGRGRELLLDYRLCVTIGGAAAMLACRILIWNRHTDVRQVYEMGGKE